ncbi:small subunit ribosomal protein S8 [Caldanaerobius fijiensis DSM 17918]|uniref:Small ribosomal subunit protein uS8 n=1 Tax=Caldanaerobius fijiensis DSM 17918 TaxID=1121256 RepID=A0A1M4YTS8_9THEO|nr:30S ribosomal protein S8 [Caldanaerobius fijiensis]SHF09170.1 small subunit ribosomal protein S8 [Caldanaerobius fijiensis DSM 17918]
MMVTDTIADMLTRIRNANIARHETVDIPYSKLKMKLASIMLDEGYIKNVEVIEDGNHKNIRIWLKYGPNKERVISGLKRISKPGLRVYATHDQLPRVLGGLGTAIISTSKGILTDKQARKEGVGGEVICYIW